MAEGSVAVTALQATLRQIRSEEQAGVTLIDDIRRRSTERQAQMAELERAIAAIEGVTLYVDSPEVEAVVRAAQAWRRQRLVSRMADDSVYGTALSEAVAAYEAAYPEQKG